MIEVKDLFKAYGSKKAVNGISFTIPEGEIVGFLGPNGAGKTTTMNIVTGYISATSGVATINGIDVLDDPQNAKRHIGYLPEHPPLYLEMTVKDYLNFVYELKKAKFESKKGHIADVCELVGISHVYNRMIKNLSKGYRQRVGLAQALIGNPPVLILDEPTVGLDPKQIIEIRNVIKELGQKRTVILSSHILPEVSAICERVLVINNGNIVADGNPEVLSQSMDNERKLVIRIAGERSSVTNLLKGLDGIIYAEAQSERETGAWDYIVESKPNIDIRRPMFNALAKSGFPILMMKPNDVSLEDLFIRLTVDEAASGAEEEKTK